MKKIKSIHIQRFRQFEDTVLHVGDFNLLVGPNNCGKTTILHALKSFFFLMHGHINFNGTPPKPIYHRRFLSSAEEIAPTPDIKELWYNQQTGKPLTIKITFDDDVTFGLSLKSQFGQIHVSADDIPEGVTASTLRSYLGLEVAFIPGLVGVLVSEPYATGARRNVLANQGRYSEIFRSSLHQLKTNDSHLIDTINEWLSMLFGKNLSSVKFEPEKDEYVTVKYKQGSSDFDVVSSGAGLQQVIQMLTYLYINKPQILLIDEPDAHLHSKLQSRLGELFQRVAKDLNAQVFLSTHSLDLIDTFSTDNIIVVDANKKELMPIGKNSELIGALIDANIVDSSALSRILSSRKLVVVEDKDQTVLKAIDKACGSFLYSSKSDSYVLSAKGVGNFRAIAEFGRVLNELTQSKFNIVFVQDRDGMPDFIVDLFIKSQKSDGITPHLLKRHEIENYLIEPALVVYAIAAQGKSISESKVSDIIVKCANELKAEARQMSMDCAQIINRHLGDDKFKDKDLSLLVNRWFDNLDLANLTIIQKVFPGKELLHKVIQMLNTNFKISLTRGILISSIRESYIDKELINFLKTVSLDVEDNAYSTGKNKIRRRRTVDENKGS
jgi:ABC-type cobalamin/Fe3+-siderophores transport system ATPase subunit